MAAEALAPMLARLPIGRPAQADVLGQDRVLTIALVQQLLKTIQDKPEIVSLIGRLVPHLPCRRAAKARALTAPRRFIGALLSSGGAATPTLAGPSTKKCCVRGLGSHGRYRGDQSPLRDFVLGASRCLEPAEVARPAKSRV